MTSAARLLRHARKRAGLTQRQLAQAAGVPQPAVARIEAGSVSPRTDTLERLLIAAGSSLEGTPRLGIGVDRSLIRETLASTPEQRLISAGAAGRNLAALLEGVARGQRS